MTFCFLGYKKIRKSYAKIKSSKKGENTLNKYKFLINF